MAIKNYQGELLDLIANDKISEFVDHGKTYINEIQADIENLEKQLALIIRLVAKYSDSPNIVVQKTIKTPKRKHYPSESPETKKRIIEIVQQMVDSSVKDFTAKDIIDKLAAEGIYMVVKKPANVIFGILKAHFKEMGIIYLGDNKYRVKN